MRNVKNEIVLQISFSNAHKGKQKMDVKYILLTSQYNYTTAKSGVFNTMISSSVISNPFKTLGRAKSDSQTSRSDLPFPLQVHTDERCSEQKS